LPGRGETGRSAAW